MPKSWVLNSGLLPLHCDDRLITLSATLTGCLMLPGKFDLPVILDLVLVILDVLPELGRLLQLQLIWNNIVLCIRKDLPANALCHIAREHCPQRRQQPQHMFVPSLLILLNFRHAYNVNLHVCNMKQGCDVKVGGEQNCA